MFYKIKYNGIISRVEPKGRENIEISLSSMIEETYSFTAYDQRGQETDTGGLDIIYSLDSAPLGVSISQGGLLTVLPDAMPGTAVIRVLRSDMPDISGTMEVEIVLPRPERAEIAGGLKAKVPSKELPLRKTYTCKMYDARGYALPMQAISLDWKLLQAPSGVSIAPDKNGLAELVLDNKNGTVAIGDSIEMRVSAVDYPEVYADVTIGIGEDD